MSGSCCADRVPVAAGGCQASAGTTRRWRCWRVKASLRPMPCGPRSRGRWPSRGSGPGVRGTRLRRRGLGPAVPADASTQTSRTTKSSRGAASSLSIAASASSTSPSAPRSRSATTSTLVAHIQIVSWQLSKSVSTAARITGSAASTSPFSASSRAASRSRTGSSVIEELSPVAHLADLGQHLHSAFDVGARLQQRGAQAVLGESQRVVVTELKRQPEMLPPISPNAASSRTSRPCRITGAYL